MAIPRTFSVSRYDADSNPLQYDFSRGDLRFLADAAGYAGPKRYDASYLQGFRNASGELVFNPQTGVTRDPRVQQVLDQYGINAPRTFQGEFERLANYDPEADAAANEWADHNRSGFTLEPWMVAAAPALVAGGMYAMGAEGLGAGAGAGAGSMAAADNAGLALMASDAGLTGGAADAFVASQGAMGSTAAGGWGAAAELYPELAQFAGSPEFGGGGFTGGGMSGGPTGGGGMSVGPTGGGSVASGSNMEILDLLKKYGLMSTKTSSLYNMGTGIYGLYKSNQMQKLAEQAMMNDNPFGPYRAGYAQKLQALYNNPKSLTKMPGYQAGLDAVTRKMASQGYLGSGNMMAALQKYGGDFFNAEAARLAQLAGAQFSPNSGAVLAGQNYSNDLASKSLASIGYGLRGFQDIFPEWARS